MLRSPLLYSMYLLATCLLLSCSSVPDTRDSRADEHHEGASAEPEDMPAPSWLRGPWKDAPAFVTALLLAVSEHSFGDRTWSQAASPLHTDAVRERIFEYNVVRQEGRRPLPVVASNVWFSQDDLPSDYPDDLLLLYGRHDLKDHLVSEGIEGEVLVLFVGHYHTSRIPQTYATFQLRWASLDSETAELTLRGEFPKLIGWVVVTERAGSPTTTIEIQYMHKS